jgi:tetratricopeptide (TPR) repeat protein/transcriptional regulator with XRE-family HTH domain
MSRETPSLLALTLLILMRRKGWNQNQIAAALDVTQATVSGWIRKGEGLDRARLEQIVVQLFKIDPAEIDRALRYLTGEEPGGLRLEGLTPRECRIVEQAIADLLKSMGRIAQTGSVQLAGPTRLRQARAQAEACWQKLQQVPPEMRTVLINRLSPYKTPAFCARICAESRNAASSCASRALKLAKLALYVAQRVPGDVSLRCQAYAWAFIANAHRVAGKLPKADAAFARAQELWDAGTVDDPFISKAYFLDLKASLRSAQRRIEDAVSLLTDAVASASRLEKGRILINKAHLQYVCGEYEHAIQTLRQAEDWIDREREPRHWFAVQFNLASCFCESEKFEEAAVLFKRVSELGLRLDQDLDLLRLRWLGARLNAGLGDKAAAVQTFEEVRKEFASQKNPFDSALVSLDLAKLYLRQEHWLEVCSVAEEMIRLFRSLGVEREPLKALLLFREAAQRRQATSAFVHRLARYLDDARSDPSYRFLG